jgi:hypothetical protein
VKNWKGLQTQRIQANQGTTPAFSCRDQGETTTNLKSGWLAYWPRFKPGTNPNTGSLLYVFTASRYLCYTPCPLTISPTRCLLYRLSLLYEVICSHYADFCDRHIKYNTYEKWHVNSPESFLMQLFQT